jgi:serine protease Do
MPGAAGLDDVQSAIVVLAASVRPAVVSVSRRGQGGHISPQAGALFLDPYKDGDVRVGSGTVVDPRGYILTSGQVAGSATDFLITWPGPPEITRRASRVANDPRSDLVLLQVQGGGSFPALSLADSSKVKIGDLVLAFGTPFGFGSTTTLGIVGSNRRKINLEGRELQDLIQVDAHLNPGDSGGPLVNIAGELVGVNIGALAMNSTFVGIGFAVASNSARRFLAGP